jgi:hypothetical protein
MKHQMRVVPKPLRFGTPRLPAPPLAYAIQPPRQLLPRIPIQRRRRHTHCPPDASTAAAAHSAPPRMQRASPSAAHARTPPRVPHQSCSTGETTRKEAGGESTGVVKADMLTFVVLELGTVQMTKWSFTLLRTSENSLYRYSS